MKTITQIAAVMVIIAAAPFILYQQQSIAQEQPKQEQFLANQTTLDIERPVDRLSFEIDNVTFSHHTASVNGIQLHYVIGGKGDPIVLLHGWPETWYEWRHIIPELIANNYTVIAPDMRGFGDSEKPLTGYDKKTVAEDIYQLVKKLGYTKIYIAAHDWGGPVAYSYAA
jgi:alpha/beta hydrolase fold